MPILKMMKLKRYYLFDFQQFDFQLFDFQLFDFQLFEFQLKQWHHLKLLPILTKTIQLMSNKKVMKLKGLSPMDLKPFLLKFHPRSWILCQNSLLLILLQLIMLHQLKMLNLKVILALQIIKPQLITAFQKLLETNQICLIMRNLSVLIVMMVVT